MTEAEIDIPYTSSILLLSNETRPITHKKYTIELRVLSGHSNSW